MDASLPSCLAGGGMDRPSGQGEAVMSIAVLGIDLAKHVFQLHGHSG